MFDIDIYYAIKDEDPTVDQTPREVRAIRASGEYRRFRGHMIWEYGEEAWNAYAHNTESFGRFVGDVQIPMIVNGRRIANVTVS